MRFQRHRESTKENYLGIWRKFNEFFIKLDAKPDEWEDRITLFIGYLIKKKLKSTTIKSYVCAIKSTLTSLGIKLNEDKTLLTALTNACKIKNDRIRTKFPLHKDMVYLIIKQLDRQFSTQPYLRSLYKAIFSMGYYGLLRIGEMVLSPHTIKVTDVYNGGNKQKLMLILRSSKTHSEADRPQIIKISSYKNPNPLNSNSKHFCPYKLLNQYIAKRSPYKSKNEPFFVFKNRQPVTPNDIRKVLKQVLKKQRLNPALYSIHMLRAGRVVDLLNAGVSVETIKKLGRW